MKGIYLNNLFNNPLLKGLIILITRIYCRIPLLDRWIFSELLTPLLFAISAFTVVSLSVGVMFDLVRKIVEFGLPVQIAIKILILKLPGFVVISFPMAMLMSSLLGYSRLSENSELKALRSIGVSTYRMVIPALIMGVLMTSLTFFFNNNIVPQFNRSSEVIMANSLDMAFSTEEGEDIIYSKKGLIKDALNKNRRGLTHLFYAWKFRNSEMIDVSVLDFSRKDYTQMLLADKAIWDKDEGKWIFINGNLVTLSPGGATTTTKFEKYAYPLGLGPKKIAQLPKDANDMTLTEAFDAVNLYKKSGNIKEERRMKVRIQEKFTFPMACMVFSLVGSSLGSRPNRRTSRSQGFGLSIILILAYYVLSFSFSSLGLKGTISPFLAAWSPVFLSFLAGGWLLNQASR